MKRIFAFVLAAVLAFSVVSCGGPSNDNVTDGTLDQTVDTPAEAKEPAGETNPVSDETIVDTEPVAETFPIVETEDVVDSPKFDTDWASNDWEKMIPKPPFSDREEELRGDACYLLNSGSANEIKSLSLDDIIAYCVELKDAGFVIEVEEQTITTHNGEGYQFRGRKSDGYAVELIYDGNGIMMAILYMGIVENEPTVNNVHYTDLVPVLPFGGWTVVQDDDTYYRIEVTGLNTSAATNPPDSGEPDGLDKDTFIGFINTLPSRGFAIADSQGDYLWITFDSEGNEIEFKCGDGGCVMTVKKVKVETPVASQKDPNGEYLKMLYNFPGEWHGDGVTAKVRSEGVDYSLVDSYVGDLMANGFMIFDIEPYDGEYGEIQAEIGAGGFFYQAVIQYHGDTKLCEISVTIRED